ncbi:hypothetical protein GUJ93_ZPchr0009g154 [Zizania palustris]|uniref:Uncharacterized protein n=1 Tax=Zizania palustris TaxID=103762 RepID=A0A8J5RLP4_ZIZPA|nr:hypothetical protein GUJ93_ZPchr0009g154 [Zizania palustris]
MNCSNSAGSAAVARVDATHSRQIHSLLSLSLSLSLIKVATTELSLLHLLHDSLCHGADGLTTRLRCHLPELLAALMPHDMAAT